MPDRQDHFDALDFTGNEAVQFFLRPFLFQKIWTDDDNALPCSCQSAIDRTPKAFAYGRREGAVPDAEAALLQARCQRTNKGSFVLAGVADEYVPLHRAISPDRRKGCRRLRQTAYA